MTKLHPGRPPGKMLKLGPGTCLIALADRALTHFEQRGMVVDEEIAIAVRLFAEWLERYWHLCDYADPPSPHPAHARRRARGQRE